MPGFIVQLTRPAVQDIGSLPEDARAEITEAMIGLQQDPFPKPPLRKRLKGFGYPLYWLRVADYRVLYRADAKIVSIMRIIDRKDLEKAIRYLKR